jgi:polysaccharide pyruvyl transferase WcaK-like protein
MANGAQKVGITGSYGGLNLGDEAILQSIITQLRRDLPNVEITVFSRDAEDTKRRHAVERALAVRNMSRAEVAPEVERLDLLILGGGGLLYDHIEVLTVRERSAQQVLEHAGVRRDIVVTADPALLLKPEPLPRGLLKHEGMDGGRRVVGMSVREPGVAAPDLDEEVYHGLLANAADFMVDRFDADVLFVPMERSVLDVQHSHAVIGKMLRAQRAGVLKGEYTSGQLLSLMKHFDFVVGMRLHFLIFAALQGTPFVALPYAGKVGGFLQDLKLPAPPINLVNPGRLIAHLDDSWDRRKSLRAQLAKSVPALQERSRQTHQIALEILKRQHPGEKSEEKIRLASAQAA